MMAKKAPNAWNRSSVVLKFISYSAIGIFMFFFPVTLGDRTTIPIDHLIGLIRRIPTAEVLYTLAVAAWGVTEGLRRHVWKKTFMSAFFFFFNLLGLGIGIAVVTHQGPEWLLAKDMAPYVFDLVAIPVGLIIPIGSVFLAFLVNFGLMEFTGEFMAPIMRSMFHTPGKSAIDAVASFVGSYSVGLMITDSVYKNNGYTFREAAIIATGFSTVSATFMIIVAKTLGLMGMWGTYFWLTLFVTFLVTSVTAHIPPLSRIPDSLYDVSKTQDSSVSEKGNLLQRAWLKGMETASMAPALLSIARQNLADGVRMASTVVPAILSFGVVALLLTKYTKIFDVTAWLFYPFFKIWNVPQAFLGAKAASISIADMFAPAIITSQADFPLKLLIGVTVISEVLFFSGMLPCLFGTAIPLRLRDIFVIWFERVALTILITIPLTYIVL